MTPIVSVIMATYNDAKFIEESIDSILKQTYKEFELIIVNDASTDETQQILFGYSDPRIIVITNEENLGRSLARNKALEIVRGDFVAVLDSDDMALPDRLEKQILFFKEHPQVDVLSGKMKFINHHSEVVQTDHWIPLTHSEIVWRNVFGTFLSHSTVMMRTEKIRSVGGYDPRWPRGQDTDLWLRLVGKARFANMNDPLSMYRVSNSYQPKTLKLQKEGLDMSPPILDMRRHFLENLLGYNVTVEEHKKLFQSQNPRQKSRLGVEEAISCLNLLFSAYHAMNSQGYFDEEDIDKVHYDLLRRVKNIYKRCPGMREGIPRLWWWLGYGIKNPEVAFRKFYRKYIKKNNT